MSDHHKMGTLCLFLSLPLLGWMLAVHYSELLTPPKGIALYTLMKATWHKPLLLLGFSIGIILAGLFAYLVYTPKPFRGAPIKKFFRGTAIVDSPTLKRKTYTRKRHQIALANIPIPLALENLHFLCCGSTGSGKSVLIRDLATSAFIRGDRLIAVDPNGDLFSILGHPQEKLLNPFDKRTQSWSIFNEMRTDYDFKRYALSIVPQGRSNEEEEWCSYGRLLLSETARKLTMTGQASLLALFQWTTLAAPELLKDFLTGTPAESLVGADKALASARFILSSKLPSHLSMPEGDFSLRRWLEQEERSNLFLTWREDMGPALKPLIFTWVDVLCTAILSLSEQPQRRIWLILDELASLNKLDSLMEAATKGRKVGLRLVATLQSKAQLDKIYGHDSATTLRSCFRNLIVLGGAKTDPKTCEAMSQSLGEHEVERQQKTSHPSQPKQLLTTKERVVLPSEIASLPPLEGYLALAGHYPITRIRLKPKSFCQHQVAFEETSF